jgi:hypothetical protein
MSVISYQNARWHIPKGSDLNIRGCGVIRSGPMHFYPSFFKLSLFFFLRFCFSSVLLATIVLFSFPYFYFLLCMGVYSGRN